MKSRNEKEFKALIKKYESLTEDMLLDESIEDDSIKEMLNRITGFGDTWTCTLCKTVRRKNYLDCNHCIFGIMSPGNESIACIQRMNEETYDAILGADSIEALLIAIKSRAKHMKEVWKRYLKQR